jgi:hypothetical protein
MKSLVTDIKALCLYLLIFNENQDEETDDIEKIEKARKTLIEMGYPSDNDPEFNWYNEGVPGIPKVKFEFLPNGLMRQDDWIEKFYMLIRDNPNYFQVSKLDNLV